MANGNQIAGQPEKEDILKESTPLFRFKSVFPFKLNPDEVILDRFKINIIKRDFFLSERVMTIPLTRNVNVKVNHGPLTSQIEIKETSIAGLETTVNAISHEDAIRFRQIVEGVVVGLAQGINLIKLSTEEILMYALEWGSIKMSH